LFLNNVSLGIYGDAVRSPAYRDAKMRTLLETAEKVLGPRAEVPALRLVDDVGREHQHLALVLVSNNPYTLNRPLTRGARPALDSGRLGIIVLDAPGAAPHHPGAAPGRAWSAPRLDVSALPPVHAGLDGEAIDLSPPLQFTIRPRALRVRISPRHQGMPSAAPFSPARRTRPLPEG
jgi:diacylglycerol kinase family enzyme